MDPPRRVSPIRRRVFQVICKSYAALPRSGRALGCTAVSAKFDELRGRLAEINDLSRAAALLAWDQQTMMPPRGAPVRAEQLATISRITHQKFTAPEIGRLLDDLAGFEQEHDHDSFEASLIRVVRRDWEKACKVPSELRAEMSRSGSLGLQGVDRRARARTTSRRSCPTCSATSSCARATSSASTATTPSRTTSCSTTTSAA